MSWNGVHVRRLEPLSAMALTTLALIVSVIMATSGGVRSANAASGGAAASSPTSSVDYLTADDSVWLIHSANPQPCGATGTAGTAYGPVGLSPQNPSNPAWNIVQWGIPCDINTSAVPIGSNGGWSVGNGYTGQIEYTPNGDEGQLVQFSQNGTANNPATNQPFLACGTEFDLFLEPNTPNYASTAQNFLSVNSSPTLDKLATITLAFGAQITYESIAARCDQLSSPDYAYYNASIVLTDTHTTPYQVLYYQVILHDSRCQGEPGCSGPSGEGDFFDNACHDGADVFENGNLSNGIYNYGVSQTVVNSRLGGTGSCLAVGSGRKAYSLNLATNVKTWVTSGIPNASPTIDRNLGDWQITGLYLGSGIQGSANVTSQYDSVNLAASCYSTC